MLCICRPDIKEDEFMFFFQSLRWGGPLSQNWLDQQLALQKKILSRMIELGMVPGMVYSLFFNI